MKLWILRPRKGLAPEDNLWEPWYNKCFGCIVRAKTEQSARNLASYGDEGKGAWVLEKYSTCEILRVNGEEGRIIDDYHAA